MELEELRDLELLYSKFEGSEVGNYFSRGNFECSFRLGNRVDKHSTGLLTKSVDIRKTSDLIGLFRL